MDIRRFAPLRAAGASWKEIAANAAVVKDRDETRLRGRVCRGATSLEAAQAHILDEWAH